MGDVRRQINAHGSGASVGVTTQPCPPPPHARHELTPLHPGDEMHPGRRRTVRAVRARGRGRPYDAAAEVLRLRLRETEGVRPPLARLAPPRLRRHGGDTAV